MRQYKFDVSDLGSGKAKTLRYSLIGLLSFSVIMVLLSLYTQNGVRNDDSVFSKARAAMLDTASPVLSLFNSPTRWIERRIGKMENYFEILEDNRILIEENERLREQLQDKELLANQVKYFEEAYQIATPPNSTDIHAQVIGENNGPFRNAMIVNAGRGDGVEVGDAVLDPKGMVGHIVTRGENASRILLLTDYESHIPVTIEGLGIQAVLTGRYLESPILEFIAARDLKKIKAGQRVVTSGAGGQLPYGLPVGVINADFVTTATELDMALVDVDSYYPTVSLYTDYASTNLVRILKFKFPILEDEAESEESETPPAEEGDSP